MHKQFHYLLIFCLLGKYSSYSIYNTDKAEVILNDIGRQFIEGLCANLDGTELFGVGCEDVIVNNDNYQKSEDPIVLDEHVYVSATVDTLGTAVGTVMRTYTDKPFYSFMGIRFGTAGTFEMPVIYEEPWEQDFMGGYDATYPRPKCPQGSLVFPVVSGSEDCLFINIFTPELDVIDPTRTYPVMVFIHGGGYVSGDTTLYVPSRLIEEDVIVVTVQYRLGTLGFLYSATTSAPGNMGLMDQVTALRWVKKYIQYFNGDEENVTVFGESAGSSSTSFLRLTPQTSAAYNNGTQLLQRAICESGSALEMWTIDNNYDTSIILHGQATGCYEETFTPDDIVACMKELTTEELVMGSFSAGLNQGIVPVIQDELLAQLGGDEELIQQYIVVPEHPQAMILNGNFLPVNMMSGANRDEGSLIVGVVMFALPEGLLTDEMFLKHRLMPEIVKFAGYDDKIGAVSTSFRLAYLRDVDMSNATHMAGGMIDLSGMIGLKTASWRMTQLMTRENPANQNFFYSFEFESDDSIFDWFFLGIDMPFDGGVTHADELLYLFALPGNPDDREKATIKKMSTLWSNFAYYGDPTPDSDTDSWVNITSKWLPHTLEQENILLMQDDFVQSVDYVSRWNYHAL